MEYNKELHVFQTQAYYISPINGLEIQKKGKCCQRIFPYSSEMIYNIHNNIVYWQNPVGGFIHPVTKELKEALQRAGYRKENIPVPCSHKETPANADVWSMMMLQSERDQREAFLDKCKKTSEDKNISTLPFSFLWNECFEIPLSGIDAIHWNKPIRIYPYAHIGIEYVHGLVGEYNICNGFISFVDEYGRMFVCVKTDKHLTTLTNAGYTKHEFLPVPFSNGETPTAMLSRCKWENICNTKA